MRGLVFITGASSGIGQALAWRYRQAGWRLALVARRTGEIEQWARAQGLSRMQLELLVPQTWTHPVKEFLRAWYARIGYRHVRTGRLDEAYPLLQPQLVTACDFMIYEKDLRRGP